MNRGLLAVATFVAALGAAAPEAKGFQADSCPYKEDVGPEWYAQANAELRSRREAFSQDTFSQARDEFEAFFDEAALTGPVLSPEFPVCEPEDLDDPSQQDEEVYPEIKDVTEDSAREVFETLSAPGGEEPMDVDVNASIPAKPQAQESLEPVDHLDVVDGQVLPLSQPPAMRQPQLDLSSAETMRALMEFRAQEEARDQMFRVMTGVSPTDLGERDRLMGLRMERVMIDPISRAMAFPGQRMVIFPDNVDPLERARIIERLQRGVDLDTMRNTPHHW
ncbi:MAG: hypothetical protein US89_C0006G0095 [Candidatus Peregrinibacteria bacterium GW2011_GWF2_38_29]|nr:MAG: hypothetical protein US89_C0006G0095 [Candidatus Peregrinibacteria bacterium GW2011_GWF2_38_29]HBB03286.1 hypothetical protein [Candidatus Peregrinibacteria bacterium]